MILSLEGKTKGADVRLWSWELPDKFSALQLGQKIKPKSGAYLGYTLRIVGKLHDTSGVFVYCDRVG